MTTSESSCPCRYGSSYLYALGALVTASGIFYGGYWYRGRRQAQVGDSKSE